MVDRILQAAARIFEQRGYAGTTTNHVAEAADVSVGSLYQYFPNKDALLVGLAERHVDEALDVLDRRATELRTDASDLWTTCRVFVTAAVELNGGDRLHRLLWTAPRTEALLDQLDRLTARLVDELTWHLGRQGLPTDVAHRRATILVPAVEAAVHEVGLDDDQQLVGELTSMVFAYASADLTTS